MNQKLSTASQAKPGTESSFAATQAAWRFYAHEDTTLKRLSEPLLASSLKGVESYCKDYALVVHDWSILNYNRHESKTDRKVLRRTNIQGYELQTSLVLNDNNGLPLGVLAQNLTTQDGVLSSYQAEGVQPELEHLQELAKRVQWLKQQPCNKPMVHLVDREGDGVEWLRACKDRLWLIRCRQFHRRLPQLGLQNSRPCRPTGRTAVSAAGSIPRQNRLSSHCRLRSHRDPPRPTQTPNSLDKRRTHQSPSHRQSHPR